VNDFKQWVVQAGQEGHTFLNKLVPGEIDTVIWHSADSFNLIYQFQKIVGLLGLPVKSEEK
jgi:predicted methyltransferase MtxX (methanogen marker protein 4)